MSHIYKFSMTKMLSGTLDIEAENYEEAYKKAEDGDWEEEDIELDKNQFIMGLADWCYNDIIQVDGEDI